MTSFRFTSWVLVALVLGAVGCGNGGPQVYSVVGKATFKNEPIADGEIVFRPKDSRGKPFAAKIVNGEFSGSVTEGEKTVEITAYRDTNKMSTANPGESKPIREMYIPEKYNSKTELGATVKPSSGNVFEFPLN